MYKNPYFKIIRPLNIIITGISTFFAYVISTGDGFSYLNYLDLILIILATTATASAGNVINDIIDVNIDKINKPNRPIPIGDVTIKSASFYYLFLIALALITSYKLGEISYRAVVLVNIILFFYAAVLKSKPFWGNFTVAFISGYLFYFASLTTENSTAILPLAISAFLFHLIREIIKDLADTKGDKLNNANTLAIYWGEKKTVVLTRIFIVVLFVFLAFLIVFFNYSISFELIIIFFVFPVLVYIFLKLSENDILLNKSKGQVERGIGFQEKKDKYESLSKLMKYDMIFGILAFYFGM